MKNKAVKIISFRGAERLHFPYFCRALKPGLFILNVQNAYLHMMLAAFYFSLMNVFTRMVSHLPVMEIVFFRCGISTLLSFAALRMNNISWRGSNRKLLMLRGLSGTIALYLFFLTLGNMPLGTAVTIQYLSPVFTSIIAIFFLGEKVKPVRWIFFALSFSGILFIKGFDHRVPGFFLAAGIISAFFSAMAYNLVRRLKELEYPTVVVLHFQLIGAVTGGLFSLFNWRTPTGMDWLWLVLIGLTTQLGQVHMTHAFQKENAANVSIVSYLGVFFAVCFGYFIFDETYSPMALLGIVLVIAGVALDLILKNKKPGEKIPFTVNS